MRDFHQYPDFCSGQVVYRVTVLACPSVVELPFMEYVEKLFITIPELALVLGAKRPVATVRILCTLWFFVVSRKLSHAHADLPLRVSYVGRSITFFLRYPMDTAVLKEVFIDKEYEWFPVPDPKVIVDLGAHFGDTALYYHAHFPDATILAVEPSPENYERLVQHVADIPNIIPIQGAVGTTNGETQLNSVGSGLGHSLVERVGTQKTVTVQQFTLGTLLQRHGVKRADVIKFDIEGGEYALFKDSQPETHARAYIGEVHPDLVPDGGDFSTVFSAFETATVPIDEHRYLIRAVERTI